MSIDPRARLHWIRNVHKGVLARSRIIKRLERQEWSSVQDTAYDVNLAAATVLYHLHHMYREDIVERETDGRKWRLAMRNQTAITDFATTTKRRESGRSEKAETQRRSARGSSGRSRVSNH